MNRSTTMGGWLLALTLIAASPVSLVAQVGDNRDGLLNPNLASAEELGALPHMSDEIVRQIVEHRPFLGIMPLHEVLSASLSGEQLEELYGRMFIPLNLNATSEAEILLVPGVGGRMAHEFDEYRPYDGIARFRREIGKYVDDDEIARLEQYVFVPIDLNSASEADILSIPGVGNRMRHEFEEYRPYDGIERFRREIGKYVDENEVARLERYVTIGN